MNCLLLRAHHNLPNILVAEGHGRGHILDIDLHRRGRIADFAGVG